MPDSNSIPAKKSLVRQITIILLISLGLGFVWINIINNQERLLNLVAQANFAEKYYNTQDKLFITHLIYVHIKITFTSIFFYICR